MAVVLCGGGVAGAREDLPGDREKAGDRDDRESFCLQKPTPLTDAGGY